MSSKIPTSDREFYESTIREVGADHITNADGWSIGIDPASIGKCKVGGKIRYYGRGIGYPVRGIVVDGHVVRYQTEADRAAEFERELAARQKAQREQYVKDKPDHDRRIALLPKPLAERIERFRANNPDFGWDLEGYELFCCEQAALIAKNLKTPDVIRRWYKLGWSEQLAMCPGLSDGHSGNTFGCACRLAIDLLENPDHARDRHGALAVLVGSEAYNGKKTQ